MPAEEPLPAVRQIELADALAGFRAHEPPSATTKPTWSRSERNRVVLRSSVGICEPDAAVPHAHGSGVVLGEVDCQPDHVWLPPDAAAERDRCPLPTRYRAHDLVDIEHQRAGGLDCRSAAPATGAMPPMVQSFHAMYGVCCRVVVGFPKSNGYRICYF